jgi:hypothetical protein
MLPYSCKGFLLRHRDPVTLFLDRPCSGPLESFCDAELRQGEANGVLQRPDRSNGVQERETTDEVQRTVGVRLEQPSGYVGKLSPDFSTGAYK